jgi:hypothetical protein
MTLLIEDSPRNLSAWIMDAADRDLTSGAVITPFASPWANRQHRRGTREMAALLHDTGIEVWFDPSTHALQMAGVGDFRYYDEYDLWGGPRGDLATPAAREDHQRLVFDIQDRLGACHLAPTILLHHGESDTSQHALDLARVAVDLDPGAWLSVAGTAPFWASGAALDAHIGALAQLQPAGWFLTVARPLSTLPVEASVEEVHGLCRSTRALSEYAPVHISHGDLAALPAVAAGATRVGTGWDQRQRICAFSNYSARDPNAEGGGWYERPTLVGLLGSLKTNEAAVLATQDAARATRLGPLPPPGPKEAFLHHLAVLNDIVARLVAQPDHERRYRVLATAYAAAAAEWPTVADITGSPLGAADWITVLANGLGQYAQGEGW